MKVQIKDAEKSQKELSIEIPKETFDTAFEAEYKKVAADVSVPGFRKGHAPKDVILKTHSQRITSNTLDAVINKAVQDAIIQNELNPLAAPTVKDVKYEEGEPITFTVLVEVFPEINIEKYEGNAFTREISKVEKGDIDEVLENIRKRQVSYEPVEAADAVVGEGDMAVIDFEGKLDGVPFPGGAAKDHSLVLGSGTFIPGFEEQVVGMKKGETKDITVTFPAEYQEPTLAGKETVFTVTLNDIKKETLPELNDEFAKDVDEEVETLAELKKRIEDELKEEAEYSARDALMNDILEKVVEDNPFELPSALVKDQAMRLAQQTLNQYRMYGIDPAQYGMSPEKLMDQHMTAAEQQIKGAIIINKIGEMNDVDVTDEEVEAKIKELAEKSGKKFEDYKKEVVAQNGEGGIKNAVFTEKVYDVLINANKVTDKSITRKEREKRMEERAAKTDAKEEPKQEKKTAAKKSSTEKKTTTAKKPAAKKTADKAEDGEKKTAAKKPAAKKPAAKKTAAKKDADKE